MSKLFERYSDWWHDKATKKAWANPRWAEIERLRHAEGNSNTIMLSEEKGLTWDVWYEQHAIFDAVNHKWWYRSDRPWTYHVHWWLQKHGLRAQKRNLRWFWQRGTRGFSDLDLWNLHSYLDKLIPEALTQLRDLGHSYPGRPGAESPEEWNAILNEIIGGFAAIRKTYDDYDPDPELIKKFERGMELLKEWWLDLWD